jgi:hypothetical protein
MYPDIDISGYIQIHPGYIQMYPRYIQIYPDTSGIYPDISEYIRIYPDTSGMYPDISGYIRDVSGYIRDVSTSGYIWIHLDISGIPRLGGNHYKSNHYHLSFPSRSRNSPSCSRNCLRSQGQTIPMALDWTRASGTGPKSFESMLFL